MFDSNVFCFLVAILASCTCLGYDSEEEIEAVQMVNFNDPFLGPADDPAKVREKASVRPFAGNVRSYAGFLSVNAAYNAKLFYWFFECANRPTSSPLILWLYGEAGRSSMLSAFEENGPYTLTGDSKVSLRENSWTKGYNILYVDSSVGAGYSSANDSAAYPRTTAQAAANLLTAVKAFFDIYDGYKNSKLYLAGESYAAKFLIPLANLIHKENEAARSSGSGKINLQALCLGAAIIDPPNQQVRADFLYQMGVVDPVDKLVVVSHEEEARKAIVNGRYARAKFHRNAVDKKIKMAGYRSPFDVLEPKYDLSSYAKTVKFFQSKSTRDDLHAGDAPFEDKPAKVTKFFGKDFHSSSSKDLAKALQNYRVLLYTGQYDLNVPTSQMDTVISKLPLDYVSNFNGAKRSNWLVNGRLAGYYKCYKMLCQTMVRRANHLIARSQPYWTMLAMSFV